MLANIELGNAYESVWKAPAPPQDYGFSLKKTDSAGKEKDGDGLPGLPEALWQLRLYQAGKCLGRIGFNFHSENGKVIVSIVNIQGVQNRWSKTN